MRRKRIIYRYFRINSWVDMNRNHSGGKGGEATIVKNTFKAGLQLLPGYRYVKHPASAFA